MGKFRKKWIVGLVAAGLIIPACTGIVLFRNNGDRIQQSSYKYTAKSDTLYRILTSSGDTVVWNARDCNVHSTFFSCARLREKADLTSFHPWNLKQNIINKNNQIEIFDTTYINLNFGEKPLSRP